MTIEQLLAQLMYNPQRKVRVFADGIPARIHKTEIASDGSIHMEVRTSTKGK